MPGDDPPLDFFDLCITFDSARNLAEVGDAEAEAMHWRTKLVSCPSERQILRATAQLWTLGGHTLHQLRHSKLTHLADADEDVTMFKAKSRYRSQRPLEWHVSDRNRR